MKKIYSHRSIIVFIIFGLLFFFGVGCFGVSQLVTSIKENNNNMFFLNLFLVIFVILGLIFNSFALNRLGNKVIYDSNNNILHREGFIRGYEYALKVEDIVDVITVSFPKETIFYIIIDKVNQKYDGGFKNSYIRIEKGEKSLDFIKQFWNKPIKECVSYFDLKKKQL